jgi:PmbA protein
MKAIIDKAMVGGASSCEVFSLSSLSTVVNFEANRLKSASRTEERGVALRVVKDGRIGFSTSTRLDDPQRIAEDAIATAAFGDEATFSFAGDTAMPGISPYDSRVAELGMDDLMTRPRDGIARLLDYESKINAESATSCVMQDIRVMTSEGLDARFERSLYEFDIGGRLIEGTSILDCDGHYAGTALDADGQRIIDGVIENFRNGRRDVNVKGGPTSVLFTPKAVADVMMTLHYGVDASMVDRGVSPLAGKLGEDIFDSRITIYDDGLAKDGFASAPFDDEGVPMQRTPVIEKGALRHFLTDLRTSAKLGLPLTGNGLRVKNLVLTKDLGRVPSPRVTNWEMAGGDTTYEELLAEMKDGIIVESIMGIVMSNLMAGDFSGNVSLGFKVEGGRVVGRVKDTMVAGNVYRLLRDKVVGLSSDVERVGQLGFIGSHRYPYLLLRDVSISAKG